MDNRIDCGTVSADAWDGALVLCLGAPINAVTLTPVLYRNMQGALQAQGGSKTEESG